MQVKSVRTLNPFCSSSSYSLSSVDSLSSFFSHFENNLYCLSNNLASCSSYSSSVESSKNIDCCNCRNCIINNNSGAYVKNHNICIDTNNIEYMDTINTNNYSKSKCEQNFDCSLSKINCLNKNKIGFLQKSDKDTTTNSYSLAANVSKYIKDKCETSSNNNNNNSACTLCNKTPTTVNENSDDMNIKQNCIETTLKYNNNHYMNIDTYNSSQHNNNNNRRFICYKSQPFHEAAYFPPSPYTISSSLSSSVCVSTEEDLLSSTDRSSAFSPTVTNNSNNTLHYSNSNSTCINNKSNKWNSCSKSVPFYSSSSVENSSYCSYYNQSNNNNSDKSNNNINNNKYTSYYNNNNITNNNNKSNNNNKKSIEYKMVQTVMNKPTRVEYGKLKCLILDAPTNDNLQSYIQEMLDYGVTDLVRTCEKTYDENIVEAAGIRVHEMSFPDGEQPPDAIIDDWLSVVRGVVSMKSAIAVHCVAGLGRAPVLVAIAFIEKGMDPLDAIMFIREKRKGAINRRQLQFLKNYKRKLSRRKWCPKGCVIM